MPHIVVEISEDLQPKLYNKKFIEELHQIGLDTQVFKEEAIKVKILPVGQYLCGGKKEPFVHIDIYLFAGRPKELQKSISTQFLDFLITELPDITHLSVDLRERNPDIYQKR
jgi:5-carboxymethyl-2-hydroxymuconate isomerase